MTRDEHASARRSIDLHFGGDLARSDEPTMRAHVAGCADCRGYYERHLLLAELDPGALPREERLGRALGIGGRAAWLRPLAVAVPALAAVALVATFALRAPDGFTARGGAAPAAAQLVVFHRDGKGGPAERAGSSVVRADELAFAYRNPAATKRLMIFGVDEHHHVYWYYPAWTDPAANPSAIPIESTVAARELPDAIAQPLDGAHLTLYGLFTDRAPTVREIEAALASGGAPQSDGDTLTRVELAVQP